MSFFCRLSSSSSRLSAYNFVYLHVISTYCRVAQNWQLWFVKNIKKRELIVKKLLDSTPSGWQRICEKTKCVSGSKKLKRFNKMRKKLREQRWQTDLSLKKLINWVKFGAGTLLHPRYSAGYRLPPTKVRLSPSQPSIYSFAARCVHLLDTSVSCRRRTFRWITR